MQLKAIFSNIETSTQQNCGTGTLLSAPTSFYATHRDRSMMLDLLGGMLRSTPGGDTDDGEEDPQEEEPEFVEETELVRWRPPVGGIPCASLLFTFSWGEQMSK